MQLLLSLDDVVDFGGYDDFNWFRPKVIHSCSSHCLLADSIDVQKNHPIYTLIWQFYPAIKLPHSHRPTNISFLLNSSPDKGSPQPPQWLSQSLRPPLLATRSLTPSPVKPGKHVSAMPMMPTHSQADRSPLVTIISPVTQWSAASLTKKKAGWLSCALKHESSHVNLKLKFPETIDLVSPKPIRSNVLSSPINLVTPPQKSKLRCTPSTPPDILLDSSIEIISPVDQKPKYLRPITPNARPDILRDSSIEVISPVDRKPKYLRSITPNMFSASTCMRKSAFLVFTICNRCHI